MNKEERLEAKELPAKYRPMGAWAYFWYAILYCIPVIGWTCLVATAIMSRNVARRSFARSAMIAYLLLLIGVLAFVIVGVSMGGVDILWGKIVGIFGGAA